MSCASRCAASPAGMTDLLPARLAAVRPRRAVVRSTPVDGLMISDIVQRSLSRLKRWDPNTDPDAERVSWPVVVALLLGIVVNLSFFYRWRYQPMMDFPFHVAYAKYLATWGRSQSIYAGLFERPDLLSANTLVYSLGACLGKIFDVLSALRFLVASLYIVGLPLAALYALRTFGRSAWGAVLSNALVFNRFYTSGFVNELDRIPSGARADCPVLPAPAPARSSGSALRRARFRLWCSWRTRSSSCGWAPCWRGWPSPRFPT